jgi:tetratricopeptide (TPR) repeat protein
VLRQAIQVAPSDARAWHQSASLSWQLGQAGEAIEKLQKAIALNADLPGQYTTLAGILAATSQAGAGQVDSAEAALREALRVDPYDAAAWDLAGRAKADKGEFPEALYNFEKAIRHRPGFAPYLYDYALTLTRASQIDRAQEQAQAAVRADPDMAEARTLLGSLFARKQMFSEAAREYRQALRLRPDLARVRLDLASVLAAQGDMPGAAHELREAAKGNDAEAARLATEALQRLGER